MCFFFLIKGTTKFKDIIILICSSLGLFNGKVFLARKSTALGPLLPHQIASIIPLLSLSFSPQIKLVLFMVEYCSPLKRVMKPGQKDSMGYTVSSLHVHLRQHRDMFLTLTPWRSRSVVRLKQFNIPLPNNPGHLNPLMFAVSNPRPRTMATGVNETFSLVHEILVTNCETSLLSKISRKYN